MRNKHNIFKVLAHACIIISGMLLTFFVIDRVNPFMEFLTSEMSLWLIFAFSLLTLTQSIMLIVTIRKHERKKRGHADYELSGDDRELARAELEKLKAEADKEFLEMLRRDSAKKRETAAAHAKASSTTEGEKNNE